MATWLKSLSSEVSSSQLVVGSKWGYEYTAAWRVNVDDGEAHEVKKHNAEQFMKQRAESFGLLPDIKLYQIHSATMESGVIENQEVLRCLADLRGSCEVGLSVSHPQVPTIEAAVGKMMDGAPLFASIQATYNLLDQSAGDALERAHAAGVFVIVKEALANGRLGPRAAMSPGFQVLQREALALDTTVDALALAWVMDHPWVDLVLSGASTAEQLRSNAAAIKLLPLSAEVHQRLKNALCMDCNQYWEDRKALAWN